MLPLVFPTEARNNASSSRGQKSWDTPDRSRTEPSGSTVEDKSLGTPQTEAVWSPLVSPGRHSVRYSFYQALTGTWAPQAFSRSSCGTVLSKPMFITFPILFYYLQ